MMNNHKLKIYVCTETHNALLIYINPNDTCKLVKRCFTPYGVMSIFVSVEILPYTVDIVPVTVEILPVKNKMSNVYSLDTFKVTTYESLMELRNDFTYAEELSKSAYLEELLDLCKTLSAYRIFNVVTNCIDNWICYNDE